MPHHANPTIACFTAWLMSRLVVTEGFCSAVLYRMPGCPQRFLDSHIHRVELMIASHLLDELAMALVFEDNEMSHQIEKSPFLKHASRTTCNSVSVDGVSSCLPIVRRGLNRSFPSPSGSNASLHAI